MDFDSIKNMAEELKKKAFSGEVIRAGDGCKYKIVHASSCWVVMHLMAEREKDVFHGGLSDCIEYVMGL